MNRLEVRPGFAAVCCIACFFLPTSVFWAFLLLCAMHELGHLAALTICGVDVERVCLGAFGAVIETGPMAPATELLCAMAGPAVNLFVFWTLNRIWPGAAIVSLALGLCNLLPVWPLDGGRALRSVLLLLLPLPKALQVQRAAEALILCAAGLGALAACRYFGAAPAVLYAVLLLHPGRDRIFLLPSGDPPDIMKQRIQKIRGRT